MKVHFPYTVYLLIASCCVGAFNVFAENRVRWEDPMSPDPSREPTEDDECCRSNKTHMCWRDTTISDDEQLVEQTNDEQANLSTLSSRSLISSNDCRCTYETVEKAKKDALAFLRKNVMKFDLNQLDTMGFPTEDTTNADGLADGLIEPTIWLSLDAKVRYEWADKLPKHVAYEYLFNYANLNEARSNWRPLLSRAIKDIEKQNGMPDSLESAVILINTHIWRSPHLVPRTVDSISFHSSQTPAIFDPMSVIAFGYGSCTGLSILFVDALRAAGVAARVVGTPAWHGNRTKGNHNWLEVYRDGSWVFMEPTTAQTEDVDHLDKDPCERWFCNPNLFPPANSNQTASPVFAARLDQQEAKTHCPLAWQWDSTDVPGENRTDYYHKVCSGCV